MKTKQRIVVGGAVLVVVLAAGNAGAATVTAKASGDWSNGVTWTSGSQPAHGDTVNVYSNFSVTVNNVTNIGIAGAINVGSTTAGQGAGTLAVYNVGLLNVTNVVLGNVNSTLYVTNGGQVLSMGGLIIGANAAGQNSSTVVVGGSDAGGNRATWIGTNSFLRLAMQNGVGNGFIVRDGAYAAFGKIGSDSSVGYGSNASNNYIIVTGEDGNGNKATLSNATYFGLGVAPGANGNYVVVSNKATVIGGLTLGGNASTNNYAIVAEGGSYSGQLKLGNHSATFGNYMIVTNGGVATIANSSGIGLGGGVSNYLAVGGTDGGGNKATLVTLQTFDIGAVSNAVGNSLQVGQSGVMTNCGTTMLGKGAGANENFIVVTNGGSIVGSGASSAISLGYGQSTNNCVMVERGGSISNIVNVHVGYQASGAVSNYVRLRDGGLLEVTTQLYVGKDGTTTGNMVTNSGGILQFTKAVGPTIAIISGNAIYMNGATLAYRNVSGVGLTNNWGTSGVGTNGIVWSGANKLRLDNGTGVVAEASGYRFATNQPMGAKNYAGLELVNGRTAVGTNITIGAAGGSVLFSNTTASINGMFTNGGAMTVFNSAVTFKSNLTLDAGCVVKVASSNRLPITVQGALMLNGGTVILPPGLRRSDRFTLFTSSNAISGGIVSMAVSPSTHRLLLGDDGRSVLVVAYEGGALLTVE